MFLKANGVFTKFFLVFAGIVSVHLHGDVVYKDLYAYAREQRSDVTAADYDIKRALQEENIALSGLFPSAHISANKQGQYGEVWPDGQLTLTLDMSIYEPAGPMAHWWLAKTMTELLRFSKEDLLDDVRYQVGQTFLSYRNVLHKNSFNEALNQSSKERFEKAKTDYAQGMISSVEFEQEKALFETEQSRIKSYINQISITQENLALASERPITGPLADFLSEPLYQHLLEGIKPFTPDQFVKEALDCRKELKIIDQRIEAAKINKDIARYSYIPTIRFVTDLSRIWGPDVLSPITNKPYRFGLAFDWEFDLENLFKFRSADADRLKSVFDRKRTEFVIENEVRTTCDQLEIIAKEIVAVRAKLAEARVAFERNKSAHDIGFISDVDFKKAETDWQQAQFNLEDKITQAAQKHEELLWATGYPKAQISCFDLIEKTV